MEIFRWDQIVLLLTFFNNPNEVCTTQKDFISVFCVLKEKKLGKLIFFVENMQILVEKEPAARY